MKTIAKMNKEEVLDFFSNSDLFEISLPLKSDEIELLGIINIGNYVEKNEDEDVINRLCEKGVITHELDLTFVGETIVENIIKKINNYNDRKNN